MSIRSIPWRALACLTGLFLLSESALAASPAYWQDDSQRSAAVAGPLPANFRLLTLDRQGLESVLAPGAGVGATLSLPKPDGSAEDFVLSDSGVLPIELARQFPGIRSYVASNGHGVSARVDVSVLGVQATVYDPAGIWIVRPERLGASDHYLSFKRSDLPADGSGFRCETHGEVASDPFATLSSPAQINTVTGAARRNYRAAVAANHNYVETIAGSMSPPATPSVEIGLAAVVAAMNRVNQVYLQDFSITMTLVPNNNLLIYPTTAGDPYSNGTGALSQNTGNINTVIGNANYDIGHVFTTGSGGVAGLGVVCSTSSKGRGTTGLTNAVSLQNDVFYIDYVAHEMGHQFGGNHTFNGTNSSCGGGNRTATAAYEPGSGSTIQAYAGICGAANDLQPHSDPYFHAKSLSEMGIYASTGTGGSCPTTVANPNAAPVIAVLANYTIPASTPYLLSGSATTAASGAVLTYVWEQYDLGAANNNLSVDPGAGPIQRSFRPSAAPRRYLPRVENLLSGTPAIGEILPTTNRLLTYRLTVRDNLASGGSSNSVDQVLTVVTTAGPFVVTAPTPATPWNFVTGPATQTVTWNVAGTDLPPVSCATVNIDLVSATTTELVRTALLASAVPNNGSTTITVPNVQQPAARVRVSCANNVFFNVSPAFVVTGTDVLFKNGFDSTVTP